MVLTLIFAVVLAILATIFALQNPTLVTANIFGYKMEGSLALFVLIGLALGLLIGILVMTPGRIKSGFANKRHRKKITELETSLEDHKARLSDLQKPAPSAPPPAVSPSQSPDTDPLQHS